MPNLRVKKTGTNGFDEYIDGRANAVVNAALADIDGGAPESTFTEEIDGGTP